MEKISITNDSKCPFGKIYNARLNKVIDEPTDLYDSPVHVGSIACVTMCGYAKEYNRNEYWIKCSFGRLAKIKRLIKNG